MKTTVYTVGAVTPVLIHSTSFGSQTIYIQATTNDIHIGGSNVSATDGLDEPKNGFQQIFMDEQETLYAIASTGTATVKVLSPSNS
jgi:hypothetical protein